MLLGYVSNERHEALADVVVDVAREGEYVTTVRSTAEGTIRADVPPGEYELTLQKGGYGGKRTAVDASGGTAPVRIRLLSCSPMLGYARPKWVVAGEEIEYLVHATEEVRMGLWRYGLQKERVERLGWHRQETGPWAGVQHTPDGDYTQTGVGWEGLGPDHVPPPSVEAPDRSGLYYFHMTAASGEFFSFPVVVAPTNPTADVAVLAATNTWNAYNSFGGRSNYLNADRLPDRPLAHAREPLDANRDDRWRHPNHEYRPLSFDRPNPDLHVPRDVAVTDPVAGSAPSHVAPAEWRFLAWLEREAYDYDLYAEYQLHEGGLDLDAYDILVIHTHPEYWSRRMYERVGDWVFDRGGNLAYLGGNGINCEIEVVDESRVRYRNAGFDRADDIRDPTEARPVHWEGVDESRFHRTVAPEGGLLGVVTTRQGMMTAAPYEVREPDHWAFEGTDLEAGDTFGEESLQERVPGGASGHETDKRSRFAPDGTTVLAKGTNPNQGGAELVQFDTDSGGSVFSAGSITYPLSLLVDGTLSRVTRNVLDRSVGRAANY